MKIQALQVIIQISVVNFVTNSSLDKLFGFGQFRTFELSDLDMGQSDIGVVLI